MGTMERRMLALQETFNDFHDFPPYINVNGRACYCWTIGGEDMNLLECSHDCAVSRFAYFAVLPRRQLSASVVNCLTRLFSS